MSRSNTLALIHIGKKDLALDDDAYRDLMARETGKRSAKDLSEKERQKLVDAMIGLGFKPRRRDGATRKDRDEIPQAGKLRALWIALYELGIARDRSERALNAFVARQTSVTNMRWLSPEQANIVIEALKDWAVRDGRVKWPTRSELERTLAALPEAEREKFANGAMLERLAVVRAQWRILLDLGAIRLPNNVTPETFAYQSTGKQAFQFYEPQDFDKVIRDFGRMIRRAQARR